jgi:DNA-binding transcriptional LysR family regulator
MDRVHHKKGKYLTMDSKKIAALLLAVEKGSLTSAATELGYTQSGLTHMMNALEQELGLNLIDGDHFCTENPVLSVLQLQLQEAFPEVETVRSRRHRQLIQFA